MYTNSHILTLNELLNEVKFSVRNGVADTDRQRLMDLLDQSLDELLQINTELSNRSRQVEDLMGRVTNLSRNMYEPVFSAQYVYPPEDDYNAVREYVKERKKKDGVFKQYCATHTRKELCERLTDEFGWVVDVKSYGRNLQRHYNS